jgi:hypothetical protein
MLEQREGVVFLDKKEEAARALQKWMVRVVDGRDKKPRAEMALHEKAPEAIFRLIESTLEAST